MSKDEDLYQKITDICFENGGVTKPMVDVLFDLVESEIDKVSKAYGGCNKCYGKGYATFKTQHLGWGTDGDIGGYEGKYKRDMPVGIKYCTCSRGKQLLKFKKGALNVQ